MLIGTGPPGPLAKTAEQLFYDTARIPENTFEDQVTLFFEPRSQISRAAARRFIDRIAGRRVDQSVPIEFVFAALGTRPRNPMFPADAVLETLKTTTIPAHHQHPIESAKHIATFIMKHRASAWQLISFSTRFNNPSAGYCS